ncbi:MAG: hypothetical protein CMJ49_13865 [Planctomycetaceae bacterium]|nr:hypothetical protein [Planctomycetaceae bacterium]
MWHRRAAEKAVKMVAFRADNTYCIKMDFGKWLSGRDGAGWMSYGSAADQVGCGAARTKWRGGAFYLWGWEAAERDDGAG